VNIELYQTFVSHFQEEDLASFLVQDIGAFHDLIDFEWLLTQRAQDILSVIWMVETVWLELGTHHPVIEPVSY